MFTLCHGIFDLEKNQLSLPPPILQGLPGRPGLPGSDGVPGPPGTILMLPVSPATFLMPTGLAVLFHSHTVHSSSQALAYELHFVSLPHSSTSRPRERKHYFLCFTNHLYGKCQPVQWSGTSD